MYEKITLIKIGWSDEYQVGTARGQYKYVQKYDLELHKYKTKAFRIILALVPFLFLGFAQDVNAFDYSKHFKEKNENRIQMVTGKIESIGNKISQIEKQNKTITEQIEALKNESSQLDELPKDKESIIEKYKRVDKEQLDVQIDNAILSYWLDEGKKIQSNVMETYGVLHSQTICTEMRSFNKENRDKGRCPSVDVCINLHFQAFEMNGKLSKKEKAIITQIFINVDKYVTAQYSNFDLTQDYLDKKSKIERKISELGYEKGELPSKIESLNENKRQLETKIELLSGRKQPENILDFATLSNADNDPTYKSRPPMDGPSDKNNFFLWSGPVVMKNGSVYIIWNSRERAGFAFKDIEKKLCDIQQNSSITVVGRYVDNCEITLVDGQKLQIPVLDSCIVGKSNAFLEYSYSKDNP